MKPVLLGILLLVAHALYAQDIYNKARASLSAGDTSSAVATFQEAVKAGQKLAESNYYLGAIAFAHHNFDDAIKYLQASLKQDDENVDAMRILAKAFSEKKDTRSALAELRSATKLAPKDCEVSFLYGQALVLVDSTDPAIIQLTRAKECDPENPWIYASLGDAYLKIGVKPLAISNYEEALKRAPKNLDLALKVARALEQNRQYTDAVRAYIVAEEIDSTNPAPYLEHGSILVRAKLYKPAIPPLTRLVKLSPKDKEGSTLYAEALFGAGEFEAAAPAAKTSLALDSSDTDIWRILAHSLVENREFKDALNAFSGLRRRNAIKQEDYIMLGRAYYGAGMDTEAMDSFQKAWASDSANCDIYFPLGSLYMKRQDYVKAAEMYEKKVACDPRSLSSYINAGITYMQPSNLNLERAHELFVKSIELKGDFLQGRLWLARYYLQVGLLDSAEAQYLEVVRLIGDQIDKNKSVYGEAQKLLGSLYMQKKQWGKAIESFRRAQSVGADDANAHLSWGQCILQTLDPNDPEEENRKKNDEALKHFTICVEKDPNNAQGHFWRGEALIRSRIPGNDAENEKLKEEACSEWKKVLKLDPKNEDAKKEMAHYGC
jgi:tetratricopeptide (TPR) repeat protein